MPHVALFAPCWPHCQASPSRGGATGGCQQGQVSDPVEGGLLFPIQAQAPGLALTGLFGTRAHP